jgi:hypothetical protein
MVPDLLHKKLFELFGLDLTRLVMLFNDNQSVIQIATRAMGRSIMGCSSTLTSRSSTFTGGAQDQHHQVLLD